MDVAVQSIDIALRIVIIYRYIIQTASMCAPYIMHPTSHGHQLYILEELLKVDHRVIICQRVVRREGVVHRHAVDG